MDLPLTYTNGRGETIDFSGTGYTYTSAPIRGYTWSYKTGVRDIAGFYKDAERRNIRVYVDARNNQPNGINLRNRIHDICEYDVRRNRNLLIKNSGTLRSGEWYTNAYIFASSKSHYQYRADNMIADLTAVLPYPVWYRDHKIAFFPEDPPTDPDWLDYEFDFEFDYQYDKPARNFQNETVYDAEFTMTFYGYVENPTVNINGNIYQVNVIVPEGARLVIDSRQKTIRLTYQDGAVYDAYGLRNKGSVDSGSYIFQKIPAGNDYLIYDDSFGIDLVLHYERSEPEFAEEWINDNIGLPEWNYAY